MGKSGVNIANFTLGRSEVGGEAIALLYIDHAVSNDVINALDTTGMFTQVKRLAFDVV
jgi:D-3-phosphoglycerate dehydrogenase